MQWSLEPDRMTVIPYFVVGKNCTNNSSLASTYPIERSSVLPALDMKKSFIAQVLWDYLASFSGWNVGDGGMRFWILDWALYIMFHSVQLLL